MSESAVSSGNPEGWLRRFFVRKDPEVDRLVEGHRAEGRLQTAFWLAMHLVPGILAYVGIFWLREPLMAATGLSNRYTQFAILILMAVGWHVVLTFALLRYVDRLSFPESLKFLGLADLDPRGLLVVLPTVTAVFTVLSAPYMAWVHPPLFAYLNSFPAIAIREWHILEIGYYDFPPVLLAVVFFANFFGEEIYFRGYLLQKISNLKGDWAANSLLFMLYHVWQAPLNWAFAPFFFLIPYGILVKLRRSLYGAIVFHVFINLAWGSVLLLLFGID